MAEHPRLNDLGVAYTDDSLSMLVHDRVLNADPRYMLKIEKQFEELSPSGHLPDTVLLCVQPSDPTVAKIRAWWVSNHKVPLLLEDLRDIALNVELTRWVRWQDVTRVCFESKVAKRIAYGPAEFTRDKDSSHYSLQPMHIRRYTNGMP